MNWCIGGSEHTQRQPVDADRGRIWCGPYGTEHPGVRGSPVRMASVVLVEDDAAIRSSLTRRCESSAMW
jgi:hypothetical protein